MNKEKNNDNVFAKLLTAFFGRIKNTLTICLAGLVIGAAIGGVIPGLSAGFISIVVFSFLVATFVAKQDEVLLAALVMATGILSYYAGQAMLTDTSYGLYLGYLGGSWFPWLFAVFGLLSRLAASFKREMVLLTRESKAKSKDKALVKKSTGLSDYKEYVKASSGYLMCIALVEIMVYIAILYVAYKLGQPEHTIHTLLASIIAVNALSAAYVSKKAKQQQIMFESGLSTQEQ